MSNFNKVAKFINNGENGKSEMRKFLEKIKLDNEKPEERLETLSFIEDQVKEVKTTLTKDKFIKYDLSELYS